MSSPYMSQILMFSGNFAPKNYLMCNGQLLPINQNQALFSLLGTTYGGNGQTNFAFPNLQGKVAMHFGNGFTQGQTAGQTTHTINISEMPAHSHTASAVNVVADQNKPGNHLFANT